jgi:hypothetical protein
LLRNYYKDPAINRSLFQLINNKKKEGDHIFGGCQMDCIISFKGASLYGLKNTADSISVLLIIKLKVTIVFT